MFTTSCSPSVSMVHPIECAGRKNVLSNQYIRTGAIPTGADQRFYDLGLTQFATQGQQAASTIGEIWVSYHVKLMKPKIVTDEQVIDAVVHAQSLPTATASNGQPFGTAGPGAFRVYAGSYMPGFAIDDDNILLPSVGRYVVWLAWLNSTVTVTGDPVASSVGSNIQAWTAAIGGPPTPSYFANHTAATSTFFSIYDVTASGVTGANEIVFAAGSNTTDSDCQIWVAQIPDNVSSAQVLKAFSPDGARAFALDDIVRRLATLEMEKNANLWGCGGDDECKESVSQVMVPKASGKDRCEAVGLCNPKLKVVNQK